MNSIYASTIIIVIDTIDQLSSIQFNDFIFLYVYKYVAILKFQYKSYILYNVHKK